jgi:hypothetical protein
MVFERDEPKWPNAEPKSGFNKTKKSNLKKGGKNREESRDTILNILTPIQLKFGSSNSLPPKTSNVVPRQTMTA